jgi:hypothetical protein
MYHGYVRAPLYSFHSMFYRFLNRHNLRSVTLEKGIPTSIANRNIYDHILINTDRYFCSEFTGTDHVRVIKWDKKYDKNANNKLESRLFDLLRKARNRKKDSKPDLKIADVLDKIHYHKWVKSRADHIQENKPARCILLL